MEKVSFDLHKKTKNCWKLSEVVWFCTTSRRGFKEIDGVKIAWDGVTTVLEFI